jgi:hypothetical protein
MTQTSERYVVGSDKEVCRLSMIEQAMELQPAVANAVTGETWAGGSAEEGGDPPTDMLWGDEQ